MKYVSSWSGGKDSAMALWRASRQFGPPTALLTMFGEDGVRSRAHGLHRDVLAAQADRIGCPLVSASASWTDYTPVYVDTLRTLVETHAIEGVVFGDIDLEPHREWCQRVCAEVGLACLHPLWGEAREELVRDCIVTGIQARVIAVKADVLPVEMLGRMLDADLLGELAVHGVDLAGEQGEYHTVVTGGPQFSQRLELVSGEKIFRDGYWFLDVSVVD